jgi:hypothetical protein
MNDVRVQLPGEADLDCGALAKMGIEPRSIWASARLDPSARRGAGAAFILDRRSVWPIVNG